MTSRNPYLILGVDYGTSPDLARRRFARAARRVRRAGGAVTIEDLNWALHQIQSEQNDPFDSVALFRVPANPAVFDPDGRGLFAPAPPALARRTVTGPADLDTVTTGLAGDCAALLSAVAPALISFDEGYVTGEDEGR